MCIRDSDLTKQEAANLYGLDPAKKTVLAVGGSLGARTINKTIQESYDLLKDRNDIQVLWQIGKLYAAHYLETPAAKLSCVSPSAVSYTHLDVYKRQGQRK